MTRTLFGGQQIHYNGGHVGSGLVGIQVVVEAGLDVAYQLLALRLQGREFGIDRTQAPGDLRYHLLGAPQRGALGQQDARFDDVALDIGKGLEFQLAAHQHADTDQKQGDHPAYEPVTLVHGPVHQVPHAVVAEVDQAGIECLAETAGLVFMVLEGVGQVVGQDQEGLHQAHRDDQDQHHGDELQHLAHVPGEEGQGPEYRDGGQKR